MVKFLGVNKRSPDHSSRLSKTVLKRYGGAHANNIAAVGANVVAGFVGDIGMGVVQHQPRKAE